MPSKSFSPEFHKIDEFNFDSAFVNSDNSASHSLGQTNLPKIRPSFRDAPFGLFRRINLIAPSRFLRLDLPSISIREHINRAGFMPLFDPHSSYPPLKIVSIDRIPVSDQKAWGGVFRKRLDQLLGCPRGVELVSWQAVTHSLRS